jgi:hypothetical protein
MESGQPEEECLRLAVTGLRDLYHHLFGARPQIVVIVGDEYAVKKLLSKAPVHN